MFGPGSNPTGFNKVQDCNICIVLEKMHGTLLLNGLKKDTILHLSRRIWNLNIFKTLTDIEHLHLYALKPGP